MNMIRGPRDFSPPPLLDDQATLARLIWRAARYASVREREAVAAVVMNRWRHNCDARAPISDACIAVEGISGSHGPRRPETGDVDYDCCCRIARRAIAGVLDDPTNGSTSFHFVDACPSWSLGRTPSAWVGGRLFYRMED